MTILVIEDNTILAKKICRYLQRSDYRVEIAQDLASARQFLSKSSASVLCLDLQLPDGNGLDLLEDASIVDRGVPVIIMTGTDLEHHTLRAQQIGIVAILIKPFALADLEKTIEFALNRTDRPGNIAKLPKGDSQLPDKIVDHTVKLVSSPPVPAKAAKGSTK